MTTGTILSFLAQRHVSQREVIASDGLVYLLQRSHAARVGVARLLGIERDDVIVEGQLIADESRPDIALLEPGSRKLLGLLELKFWAELTTAQPGEYLGKLETAGGGQLLFVAPTTRHIALWKELLDRAHGFVAGKGHRAVMGDLSLRLIAWEDLFAPIAAAVGGSPLQADLEQLRGLVRDFESAQFRPFQQEDLSNLETPRLVMALSDLADSIAKQAEADGAVLIGGLRPTHGWHFAGRYVMVAQRAGAWFGLSHAYWARHGLSPLWLEFAAVKKWDQWSARHLVREAVGDLLAGASPVGFEQSDGSLAFAVPVAVQVERDAAAQCGAKWLRDFGQRLIDAGLPVVGSTPAPES